MAGPEAPPAPERWDLIRDVLVFQVKLALDALRDVLLSPISLFAALLDLLSGDRPRPYFYETLVAARRSERFIDLFGAADRIEPRSPHASDRNVDRVVEKLEVLLAEQVEKGGVTAHAKEAIDRRLDAVVERTSRRGGADSAEGS